MAGQLKQILLEVAIDRMLKTGDLNPEAPESVKKACKLIVGELGNLSEEEIAVLIHRKCGGASKPIAGTRPPPKTGQ